MSFRSLALASSLAMLSACASSSAPVTTTPTPVATPGTATPPSPDPRIGLSAGLTNAGEAAWNMRLVSNTRSPQPFAGDMNSDLAFTGKYAIQGNFQGFQIWDISNPARPSLTAKVHCPAQQSDVSVYKHLLFVSAESRDSRLDCGTEGNRDRISMQRILGIRIFDISDITNPKYIGNVQTCRGSHTHTVLVDPRDTANVYVYVSGSSAVRAGEELRGCVNAPPSRDPNSALFRIEVIRVPLANPTQAAIVSSPRIFNDLVAPPTHGETPIDPAAFAQMQAEARARGEFAVSVMGLQLIVPKEFSTAMLDSLVRARGGTGTPTAADSARLREALPAIVTARLPKDTDPKPGPDQCHDITVYPAIGLAGGACEGYGLLLDIRDPARPTRLAAVADSNFAYWHSATFNNDGSKVLFSDEWGGGVEAKCRVTDRKEWGANTIFTIENGRALRFQSYYKLPAPQTQAENCVAHNGSLVPVPGRDIMVQAWYQGGISVFEFTDPARPREIAFHDRGPVSTSEGTPAGSWSAYWYNGYIYSSEIARGLDVLELIAGPLLTQNELDAAKTVRFDYLNVQGQQRITWPASFALARAYVDQLERSGGLSATRIAAARQALGTAEGASGSGRRDALTQLATQLDADARQGSEMTKVATLARTVRDLAAAAR
jgi:hypothetical protein